MSVTNLIVGASSGLCKALAYEFSKKGENVILVARGLDDLKAISNDLNIKYSICSQFIACDIAAQTFDEFQFYNQIVGFLKKTNSTLASINLIAGGAFAEDDNIPSNSSILNNIYLNFIGPVKISNIFLKNYNTLPFKKILFVSSIACIKPRRSNIGYTSSKTALESYALSIRHSVFQNKIPVNIQILRLGYMESQFTQGKALLFPIANPVKVAKYLVKNQNNDLGLFYFPKFWWFIKIILKLIPWFIFRKLNF